jgi:hypothetical protein
VQLPINGQDLLLHLENNIQNFRDKEVVEIIQLAKKGKYLSNIPFDHLVFNIITLRKFSEDTLIELLDDFRGALRMFDIGSFYDLDAMPKLKLLLKLKD